jgi:hypothetical protein
MLLVATSAIDPPGTSGFGARTIWSSPVKSVAAYDSAMVSGTGG